MKKSVELRQERQTEIDAQKSFVESIKDDKGETRSFTDDEQTKFDEYQTRIDSFAQRIKNAEAFEENQRMSAAVAGAPVVDAQEVEHQEMKKRYSLHKAIRSQMPNGVLDGVELEIHQETLRKAKDAGVAISGLAVPMPSTRADGQTVTQDAGAYGGNLVAEELQSPIEFLRPNPILRSMGARFMGGLQGNLKFPTNDGGITGAWEGEVDETANSKTAYGSKEMKPNRYAVAALLSLQNLMQSSIDLERYTIEDINAVIANAIDEAGINGSGSSNVPLGILNASGTNPVVGGTNGAAPSWDHIVDMETGIYTANADVSGMGYLINPPTKGKLKKTKHSAGDLNYLMANDNTINGYKVGVSNLVPGNLTKGTLSGTANAGIFGDFRQLLIGQWGFLDLSVDDKSRKKEGYIELVVNTFLDVLVRQPKAFSVIKDWDIS